MSLTGRVAGDGFEVFVRPFYAVAVVDIIRYYGWQDIWYLYSSDQGLSYRLHRPHRRYNVL